MKLFKFINYYFLFIDNEWKLFKETIQATEKLCSHIYQTFYKISFRPISFYLEQVEKVKFNKETSDRLSPREYITQVMLYLIFLILIVNILIRIIILNCIDWTVFNNTSSTC